MRVLNEAWRVLGDRRRRAAYDATLVPDAATPALDAATLAPEPGPAAGSDRTADVVMLAPAALVAAGCFMVFFGMITLSASVLALAAGSFVAGVVGFALAPLYVLRRDRRRR